MPSWSPNASGCRSELDVKSRLLDDVTQSGAATTEQLEASKRRAAAEASARLRGSRTRRRLRNRWRRSTRRRRRERLRRSSRSRRSCSRRRIRRMMRRRSTWRPSRRRRKDSIRQRRDRASPSLRAGQQQAVPRRCGAGSFHHPSTAATEKATTGQEAIKILVTQRTKLRLALRSAAEQVQLAHRKLNRANARNTLLTGQVKAAEKADLAEAKARAAESARCEG